MPDKSIIHQVLELFGLWEGLRDEAIYERFMQGKLRGDLMRLEDRSIAVQYGQQEEALSR